MSRFIHPDTAYPEGYRGIYKGIYGGIFRESIGRAVYTDVWVPYTSTSANKIDAHVCI